MTATATTSSPCPRCGNPLYAGQLVCPSCGGLVYAQRLNEIAFAAQQEEPRNPQRAAMIWREALPLLPEGSQPHQSVLQRINALTEGAGVSPPTARNDPWNVAVAKTVGSMLLSIVIYAMGWGWQFATGFVLIILVHELGHVLAMRYYGLSASPPIFIPFLGAVINLRQPPRNALEEAVIGIAGPVTGAIAATVAFIVFMQTGSALWFELASFGFLLNLFNMLPVPPLDGGRVTAAVSPWLWIPGLLIAAGIVVGHYIAYRRVDHVDFILILLLVMAWPRVKSVLTQGTHRGPYYQIGRAATWGMGAAYVLLGGYLAVMFFLPQILLLLSRVQ